MLRVEVLMVSFQCYRAEIVHVGGSERCRCLNHLQDCPETVDSSLLMMLGETFRLLT